MNKYIKTFWNKIHFDMESEKGAKIYYWLIKILIVMCLLVLPVVMTTMSLTGTGQWSATDTVNPNQGVFWMTFYILMGIIGFIWLLIMYFGFYKNKNDSSHNDELRKWFKKSEAKASTFSTSSKDEEKNTSDSKKDKGLTREEIEPILAHVSNVEITKHENKEHKLDSKEKKNKIKTSDEKLEFDIKSILGPESKVKQEIEIAPKKEVEVKQEQIKHVEEIVKVEEHNHSHDHNENDGLTQDEIIEKQNSKKHKHDHDKEAEDEIEKIMHKFHMHKH